MLETSKIADTSLDDDNFDDDDDYYEEDEEYEEDPDVAALAAAKKAAEAKKAAAAQVSKKAAAAKAKAESAAKNTAAPVVPEVSSKDQKKKIEEDNRKMNYQLSAELFGGVDIASISRPSIKLPEDSTFETFTPKTDAEFELLAQYVGGHIAISSVRKKGLQMQIILFLSPFPRHSA